jgi:hypothetical protein
MDIRADTKTAPRIATVAIHEPSAENARSVKAVITAPMIRIRLWMNPNAFPISRPKRFNKLPDS